MRLQSIILLVASILLAADLVVADSKTAVTPNLRASLRNDIPPTRFLRTGTATDEDEDARAITLRIAGLESLMNRLKSASQLKVKELVNSGQNIDDAFLFLKLKDAKTDLFTNSDFKIWARFAAKIDKKNSANSMFATLQKNFEAKDLTLMIQAATEAKETSKIAKKLQKVQFEHWASNSMWPEVAVAQALKIDENLILHSYWLSPARLHTVPTWTRRAPAGLDRGRRNSFYRKPLDRYTLVV